MTVRVPVDPVERSRLDLSRRPEMLRVRGRLLAIVYLLCGLFRALSIVFPELIEDRWSTVTAVEASIGLIGAPLLWFCHRWIGWYGMQAATVLVSVLIGASAAAAQHPSGVLSLGPVMIALAILAAYTGTRREVLLQIAGVLASYVLGALISPARISVLSTVSPVLAVAVVGPVVLRLVWELRRAGAYDPLTGVLNRYSWELITARHLEQVRRRPDQHSAHLVLIDLDHFKQVNDTRGHLAGDELLCDLATAWRTALGPDGWIGRFGGDEFVVLVADRTEAEAAQIVERLRQAHPAEWSWGQVRADGTRTVAAVVAAADANLLAAKGGRAGHRTRHASEVPPVGSIN